LKHIAYFITPHGYGHATRSIAIMAAWLEIDPQVHFHVVTAVNQALFNESLGDRFTYHYEICDVGLIQQDAMHIDEAATVKALEILVDPTRNDAQRLGKHLLDHQVEAVVCDIATLGLLAAKAVNLPLVLVENFTWDFIYRGYAKQAPLVAAYAERFTKVYRLADHHIQIDPPSEPVVTATLVPPVARPFRESPEVIRQRFGVSDKETLVLITTGGVGHQFDFCRALADLAPVKFLLSGQATCESDNLIHLDQPDLHYHPDLVRAADLVVGKIGYSTLTETYHAGTPFAYIRRPDFIEGLALKDFADTRMSAAEIEIRDFLSGAWIEKLDDYLALEPLREEKPNGADFAAQHLMNLFSGDN
jgi:UDP-N-acetylglucosamine:LPS N-acetylglucosamine transferase